MKKKIVLIAIFMILGICSIGFVQIKYNQDFFDIMWTSKQQIEFGLHKLSKSERSLLSKSMTDLFTFMVKSKELGDSAVEYLKEEGWEEVVVVGKKRLKLDRWSEPEEYLIVEESYWTYVLEPRTYYYQLNPGKYLGKMSYSSCEIIDSDGDIIEFWTKEKK